MTSISTAWMTNENYWEVNPMHKEFGVFKIFYKKDKTKSKDKSSKILWAVAMLIDPNESNLLKNHPLKDKKRLIAEDYLEDADFNWEHPEIEELKAFYLENCLSIAEKELIRYEEKLYERGEFISKTHYSMDYYDEETGRTKKGTADQLDKMFAASGKIFTEIENIKEKISKEDLDGQLKGGAEESASEAGTL